MMTTEPMNESETLAGLAAGFGEDLATASVDLLFLDVFPMVGERSARQAAAMRRLLGLAPVTGSDPDPWPTHAAVADDVGVPRCQARRSAAPYSIASRPPASRQVSSVHAAARPWSWVTITRAPG